MERRPGGPWRGRVGAQRPREEWVTGVGALGDLRSLTRLELRFPCVSRLRAWTHGHKQACTNNVNKTYSDKYRLMYFKQQTETYKLWHRPFLTFLIFHNSVLISHPLAMYIPSSSILKVERPSGFRARAPACLPSPSTHLSAWSVMPGTYSLAASSFFFLFSLVCLRHIYSIIHCKKSRHSDYLIILDYVCFCFLIYSVTSNALSFKWVTAWELRLEDLWVCLFLSKFSPDFISPVSIFCIYFFLKLSYPSISYILYFSLSSLYNYVFFASPSRFEIKTLK